MGLIIFCRSLSSLQIRHNLKEMSYIKKGWSLRSWLDPLYYTGYSEKNCQIPLFTQVFIVFAVVSKRIGRESARSEDTVRVYVHFNVYTVAQLYFVMLALTFRVQKKILTIELSNIFTMYLPEYHFYHKNSISKFQKINNSLKLVTALNF